MEIQSSFQYICFFMSFRGKKTWSSYELRWCLPAHNLSSNQIVSFEGKNPKEGHVGPTCQKCLSKNPQPANTLRVGLGWLVLSDEQMSKKLQFSLLNDEQMSNKVGVEHQPVVISYFVVKHISGCDPLPGCNRGKWRFSSGCPTKKCSNSGGHCYWEGAAPNRYPIETKHHRRATCSFSFWFLLLSSNHLKNIKQKTWLCLYLL